MKNSGIAWVQRICTAAVIGLTSLSANATVITNGDGNAVAVNGIAVAGTIYNVTFEIGSFDSVFGSGTPPANVPTFFGDEAGAEAALQAIATELNNHMILLVEDASGDMANSVLLPFEFQGGSSVASSWTGRITGGVSITPLPWHPIGTVVANRTASSHLDFSFAFAQFTEVPVAEPGTLAILGFGLAGLGLARRNRAI